MHTNLEVEFVGGGGEGVRVCRVSVGGVREEILCSAPLKSEWGGGGTMGK